METSQTPAELQAIRQKTFSPMNNVAPQLFKELKNVLTEMRAKLSEQVFVQYFLPYFAGNVQPENHVSEWIAIAGSPSSEVDVVGDNGQLLFSVPPLLDTKHINTLRPDGALPFASIVALAAAMETKSPQQSQEHFINAALQRYKASHNSDYVPTELERRWMAIFIRYGVTIAGHEAEKATTETPKDDFEQDFIIGD